MDSKNETGTTDRSVSNGSIGAQAPKQEYHNGA